jgi:MFS family permease
MRKLWFALGGLILGAGLALILALPQSAMSRAVDTQGLHLIGVLFVAVPIGAVLGTVLGLLVERMRPR